MASSTYRTNAGPLPPLGRVEPVIHPSPGQAIEAIATQIATQEHLARGWPPTSIRPQIASWPPWEEIAPTGAMVNDTARHHSDEAHRADQAAASYRQRLGARQHNQDQARLTNQLNASRRAEALALAPRQRAELGALRQYRQDHVANMAPEEVTAVDQARTRRTKELEELARLRRDSERRLAASQEPYRSPSRSGPDPGRHREGPGIGM